MACTKPGGPLTSVSPRSVAPVTATLACLGGPRIQFPGPKTGF